MESIMESDIELTANRRLTPKNIVTLVSVVDECVRSGQNGRERVVGGLVGTLSADRRECESLLANAVRLNLLVLDVDRQHNRQHYRYSTNYSVRANGGATHDWFCFSCHSSVESYDSEPLVECGRCWRAFHVLCADGRTLRAPFVCEHCVESLRTKRYKGREYVTRLNHMIATIVKNCDKYLADNGVHIDLNANELHNSILVFNHLDLNQIRQKCANKEYTCAHDLALDFKQFCHNFYVSTLACDASIADRFRVLQIVFEREFQLLKRNWKTGRTPVVPAIDSRNGNRYQNGVTRVKDEVFVVDLADQSNNMEIGEEIVDNVKIESENNMICEAIGGNQTVAQMFDKLVNAPNLSLECIDTINSIRNQFNTIKNRLKVAKITCWCAVCRKEATISCCLVYWYCSEECQRTDWRSQHSSICTNVCRNNNIPSDSEEIVVKKNEDQSNSDGNSAEITRIYNQLLAHKSLTNYRFEITSIKDNYEALIHELIETKNKIWCIVCDNEALYHCCSVFNYCSEKCISSDLYGGHRYGCVRMPNVEYFNIKNRQFVTINRTSLILLDMNSRFKSILSK